MDAHKFLFCGFVLLLAVGLCGSIVFSYNQYWHNVRLCGALDDWREKNLNVSAIILYDDATRSIEVTPIKLGSVHQGFNKPICKSEMGD